MLKTYVKYFLIVICLPCIVDMQASTVVALPGDSSVNPSFFQTYRMPALLGASAGIAGAGSALQETDRFAPCMMWGGGALATALLTRVRN